VVHPVVAKRLNPEVIHPAMIVMHGKWEGVRRVIENAFGEILLLV
jgi:hypothetical protein